MPHPLVARSPAPARRAAAARVEPPPIPVGAAATLAETGAPQVTPAPPAPAEQPENGSPAATDDPYVEAGAPAGARPIPRRVPGAHWAGGQGHLAAPTWPAGGYVPRRVPGAHLAALDEAEVMPIGRAPIDPDAERRQVDDVQSAILRATDNSAKADVGLPAADLARRVGVRRRVPGAALGDLNAAEPARPTDVATAPADPDEVRTSLDDVTRAVELARGRRFSDSLTEQRRAAQAVETDARVREAALKAALGRLEEQQRTVADLAGELRAAPEPAPETAPEPEAAEPEAAEPEAAAPVTPAPPVRRVPGAALAALTADSQVATGPGTDPPTRTQTGRRGVGGPERPEDVLAWVEDLEHAMTDIPPAASTTVDRDTEADSTASTENGERP
jgi:hypothetical protein